MAEVVLQKQDCCYLSTPEHVQSFFGRFVYIYTGKGRIELTEHRLRYVGSKDTRIDIPLADITYLGTGHYSRLAKPFRLDYLSVTFDDGSSERTVLFTPTKSWLTPVWETNEIVAAWRESVRLACPPAAEG